MTEQQSPEHADPKPGHPHVPASYGVHPTPDTGTIEWSEISARLAGARNYWVATTRPEGRPHTMPVWGLWLEEAFYFATDRTSRKGRNLAANPALAVHLESGDDVVILEGTAEELLDATLRARFADAYEAKYRFRPELGNPSQVIYRLRPRIAHTWFEKDFPSTATRWRFDRD